MDILERVLADNNITKEQLQQIYDNAVISGQISFMIDFNEYVKMLDNNKCFIIKTN